mgnify:CR=1 FL=1
MAFRIEQIPILYEDDEILVLNKPAGISVIPERYEEGELSLLELLTIRGEPSGAQNLNLTELLSTSHGFSGWESPGDQNLKAAELRNQGGAVDKKKHPWLRCQDPRQYNSVPQEPLGTDLSIPLGSFVRPVHRIDKETSGVVLFAKTEEAFRGLSLQFQERTLTKIYHALVEGRPGWVEQNCDVPLRVDGDRRHRTIVHREGKPSRTFLKVLETFRGFALVEAQPKTGRTHQIRVHLSYLGHPIVGDALYRGGEGLFLSAFKRGYVANVLGTEKPLIRRTALHALSLEFTHPRTGEHLRFEAPYPKDLAIALKQLRRYGK